MSLLCIWKCNNSPHHPRMLTAPVINGSFSLVPELRMWNCMFSKVPVAPSDWQFRKLQMLTNRQRSWRLQQAKKKAHFYSLLPHMLSYYFNKEAGWRYRDDVEENLHKKGKDEPERLSWRRGREGGCGNHEDGSVIACVSLHIWPWMFSLWSWWRLSH